LARLNALIVIYNKSLAESAAVRSLEAREDVSVFIADNSTQDCGNSVFAQSRGYRYIDMGGNMGLSRAYNRAISLLDETDGLICLFDDDTTVDSRYFEALEAAAAAHPDINLFAPVVRDAGGILSPCTIHGAACRRLKSLEDLPQHGVSVVNSGLAIRLKVFRDYRYDEGQFLDYIDHAFIRDIAGNDLSRIYIMKDVVLQQCFSGSERQSRSAAMARYRVFRKDIGYFCRKYGIAAVNQGILLFKRRLKAAWIKGR